MPISPKVIRPDPRKSATSVADAGKLGRLERFTADRNKFLDAFERLRLPEAMAETINYEPVWSDILVERLRSGRGSAIQGQRRGRGLEDFVEAIVKEIFGEAAYETRCTFTGADNKTAKCDLAIPDRNRPRIIIEVKGYGATGSKMSDIIGDLDAIIDAKRHDSTLLFVTDGMTWKARQANLKKIVQRQNQGKIARIYTIKMRDSRRGLFQLQAPSDRDTPSDRVAREARLQLVAAELKASIDKFLTPAPWRAPQRRARRSRRPKLKTDQVGDHGIPPCACSRVALFGDLAAPILPPRSHRASVRLTFDEPVRGKIGKRRFAP